MQYGETIKKFRKEKGITQEDLGNILGKKQNQISEWESGKIRPTPDDIINICDALDVSLQKFYGFDDDYDLAIEFAKGKGITPQEIIKAIEIYDVYRNK